MQQLPRLFTDDELRALGEALHLACDPLAAVDPVVTQRPDGRPWYLIPVRCWLDVSGQALITKTDILFVRWLLDESFGAQATPTSKDEERNFEIQIYLYGYMDIAAEVVLDSGQKVEVKDVAHFPVPPEAKAANEGEFDLSGLKNRLKYPERYVYYLKDDPVFARDYTKA